MASHLYYTGPFRSMRLTIRTFLIEHCNYLQGSTSDETFDATLMKLSFPFKSNKNGRSNDMISLMTPSRPVLIVKVKAERA